MMHNGSPQETQELLKTPPLMRWGVALGNHGELLKCCRCEDAGWLPEHPMNVWELKRYLRGLRIYLR